MKKGIQVLVSAIVMQICLGGVYAWSIYTPVLRSVYGLSGGQTGSIFGITIAVFSVAMIFAGRFQEKYGPRIVSFIGALFFAAGYILSSRSNGSFLILIAGIGILSGIGIGCGYVCALATAIKWYPKRKGLITGIAVMGFGGGAILVSKIANGLMSNGMDVLQVFLGVGLVMGVILLACALLLKLPSRMTPGKHDTGSVVGKSLRQPRFISLVIGMFAGTFGGLLVIGNLAPIGLSWDFTSAQAAVAIGLFSIGNMVGRFIWGVVYDRIKNVSIPLSLVLMGIAPMSAWRASTADGDCNAGSASSSPICRFSDSFVLYRIQFRCLFCSICRTCGDTVRQLGSREDLSPGFPRIRSCGYYRTFSRRIPV